MVGTTTIVFTDVTASTELVRRLGDAQAASVMARHVHLLRTEAEQCHGRVAKTLGDGVMALFPTAYDAAVAATAMQQSADRAARRGETPEFGLRIGINVGDVVDASDNDVFGVAVVVARRLCDAAKPGQILASDLVRLLIGNRPDVRFIPLDPVPLKGMPDPVGAIQLEWSELPADTPLRIIVADDVALVRSGVVRLLLEEGFDVIAEVGDYDALIAAIDRDPPDLVVTDIRMPPTQTDEGLRAAGYLKSNYPHVAVLILSQHIVASAAVDLLSGQTAGLGYLLKERVSELDDFVRTARLVADGQTVIDPLVSEQLLARRRADAPLAALTERETEVLALMAQGMTNQAVCGRLFLSPKTVETHVRSIFTKLGLPESTGANRRVQAVVQWLKADQR
ncbi:MAG: LuxR C-terminal-related transcriptional regulator [Acidimicrobiales bacterium]